ncbi:hypothetical protein L21SP5_02104 [Salinivirga cyanobacteriivorans]|uniref:DUF3857 domain-containing protein n=1 Tax=Salinivirga cyanobacteriivorans TaxID=1307839 RepID=A0A0S2I0E0_9BACT|nr:DUF3857 domain-containing protein [Salinivirga cyanobacteriivorans]ALO15741.1 hypothetical protein L21SP5_02104 [Salinivirga cyanobacteriivorans]
MKLLTVIISLLIGTVLYGQESDATYLKLHKTYTLNKNGSYKLTYQHELKYHTYLSFHRKYGETFVVYDPDYQKVNVLKSQTTMADGKVVNAPENAFNEVLPRYALGSGAYNKLRELVITHTGLEQGAVVDLKYEVLSEKAPLDLFAGSEPLRYSSPVKELKLTFKVPKSRNLVFAGDQGEKVYNETEDYKVYTFTYNNLPAYPKASLSSGAKPHVLIFNEGKSFADQLMAIVKGEALPADYAADFSPAMEENMDEVLKIHRDIVKDMKTIHVPMKFQEFPVQDFHATELTNSGTPLEKALLLKQLYIGEKIPARIVFSVPVEQFDTQVSNIENITDVFVMVPTAEGDPLLLSPYRIPAANPLYTNYDKALVAVNGDGKLMRLNPAKTNYAEIDFTLGMGEDFSEAQYKGKLTGALAGWPGANFEAKQLFTNYIKEVENDLIIEGPASVTTQGRMMTEHYQVEEYLQFFLPMLKNGANAFIQEYLATEGNYAVDFGYPLHEVYRYTLQIEEDQEIVRTPEDINISNDYFDVTYKTQTIESGLEIILDLNIKAAVVPAKEYKTLRKAFVQLKKERSRKVTIKTE